VHPEQKYPVLGSLLNVFRWTQKRTLGLVVAGLIEVASARSFDIADCLSAWLGVRFKSALNRFYRLLANHKFDDLQLTKQMLAQFGKSIGKRLLIAVDWTEWHHDQRILLGSVVADRRAIPVHAAAFNKLDIPRSQNSRENAFATTLSMVMMELGLKALVLCDRGFRRVSWLKHLLDRKLDFAVRLQEDIYASSRKNKQRLLSQMGLQPGHFLDLGWVDLRDDAAVSVRVIGVWAAGAKEPWWLATNLNERVANVVAYYDRRMAVEEQIRDTKGCRFGAKLYWTQFKKPEHLARFVILLGMALIVWTAMGVAATAADPTLRLPHPTKGPRCSYITIGMRLPKRVLQAIPLTATNVFALIPKPVLRNFAWLS
jgi:hypothetical protein